MQKGKQAKPMVRRGKQQEPQVDLPENWWPNLKDWIRSTYPRRSIYEVTGISPKTFKAAQERGMPERTFFRLAEKLKFDRHSDLLHVMSGEKQLPRPATPIPEALSLSRQIDHPQGADYRDYSLEISPPWALRCRIATESPYFRFGFKLLGEKGRPFGDGVINSRDENLIVHIGRNNWDRPNIGLTARDVGWTAYVNGNYAERHDHRLFTSELKIDVAIELIVDRSYFVSLVADGRPVPRRFDVSPAICSRVVIYAWADGEEFKIEVTGLTIQSI